jgi:hypothetical protein
MEFGDDFQNLLPSYLTETESSRLKDALKQFLPERRGNNIDYNDFYRDYQNNYFLQADTVREIRFPFWNSVNANYEKLYTDALIISNTCDISLGNNREYNQKECLLAPIIEFSEYLSDLAVKGYSDNQIQSFENNIKAQLISNIFYLPNEYLQEKEYIVWLDRMFWLPTQELNMLLETIKEDRISSLSHYGYYLFILKLSYHLCRLPEKCDREIDLNR